MNKVYTALPEGDGRSGTFALRYTCKCGALSSTGKGGFCSICRSELDRQINTPEPNVNVLANGSCELAERSATFEALRPEFKVTQRKYLPTLSDLVDRLTIVQLKSVFITDHTEAYVQERKDIEHDIDLILEELAAKGKRITATEIHAIIVIMLSNRFIWENESKARQGGSEHDHLLKLTHSINGVRNTAKNQLANIDGGRRDYKTDCFAAELTEQFGNWNIFS